MSLMGEEDTDPKEETTDLPCWAPGKTFDMLHPVGISVHNFLDS